MIAISWNKGSIHLAEINPGSRNQPFRDWTGAVVLFCRSVRGKGSFPWEWCGRMEAECAL